MNSRILLIENDPEARQTLHWALRDQAYDLQEVSTLEAALESLKEFRPHIVMADVFTPGGIDSFLEKAQTLADPPFVIVIAPMASREAAIQALRAGALTYIIKPLTVEEVRARVERVVERQKSTEDMRLRMIQTEKMASLGRLVAGVAHEINTPVGAIQSNSDLLRRLVTRLKQSVDRLPSSIEKQEICELLVGLSNITEVDHTACERIVHVVKNLKTFARPEAATDRKMFDVHEGLDSTLRIVQYELKNRIRVEKDYGKLPLIECYPNLLNQVFMNLLVNAVEAIEGNGLIRIETRSQSPNVVIRISDTGKGISPSDLSKVFDPGFTTKGVGVGTGLGLSLVYKMIQDHGGTIAAESEVGKGTTFTIALPVH